MRYAEAMDNAKKWQSSHKRTQKVHNYTIEDILLYWKYIERSQINIDICVSVREISFFKDVIIRDEAVARRSLWVFFGADENEEKPKQETVSVAYEEDERESR